MTMLANTVTLFICSLILQKSVASFIQQQDTARIVVVLLSKIIYFFAGKILMVFFLNEKIW